MARIVIDLTTAVPPYEHIRSQLAALITAGVFRPQDRLPTVRDLAADLGVANGTVQRAYRELEAAGLTSEGTYVPPTLSLRHLKIPDLNFLRESSHSSTESKNNNSNDYTEE